MIAQLLDTIDQRCHERPAILAASQVWTYGQLNDASHSLAVEWAHLAGSHVVLAIPEFSDQLVALIALERVNATAILIPSDVSTEALLKRCESLNPKEVLTEIPPIQTLLENPSDRSKCQELESAGDQGSIILFTSGTSGPPEPARHSWKNLASTVHQGQAYRGKRWLQAYQPSTFAGVQVWMQALLSEGTVCFPESNQPEAIARVLVDQRIEFASATPTYWRMLLTSVSPQLLDGNKLQQITLGGEAIDQEVLDSLATTFPGARISHIYASTEMGVCFSVHDGKSGFPATLLDSESQSPRLRISDEGELEIQSDRGMLSAPLNRSPSQSWFATGDLVQVRDDRVYFIGRKSGTINVGGSKVLPEEVEEVVRRVPGVREVRVVGLSSSLVGQLVQAEVLPESGTDRVLLRDNILTHCRANLPKHKVPATIQFLEQLEYTPSGKLARTVEQTP